MGGVQAGDPSRPVWTGGWFGRSDAPSDETGKTAQPPLKLLRTGQGLLLAFDDDGKTIALSDGNGSNLLKIKVNEGQLRVQATTKVIVEPAPSGASGAPPSPTRPLPDSVLPPLPG